MTAGDSCDFMVSYRSSSVNVGCILKQAKSCSAKSLLEQMICSVTLC